MALAIGKIWWDSGVLSVHRSVRFCDTKMCAWVLPKAGGCQGPGVQIWDRTKACHTLGSLQAQEGPQPGGTKVKTHSRDHKSGKDFSELQLFLKEQVWEKEQSPK